MFEKICRFETRAARRAAAACALALMTGAGIAQNTTPDTSSSSAGQTGNAAPGTAPMPAQTDGQTTAAPGSAPMRSHVLATQITPQRVTKYDDRWELYAGLSFMNGQAGQDLTKRYNMGGGEVMATYWLGSHLGIAGDYRFEAGTTPILPVGTQFGLNRVTVKQSIESGGVNYRGPKNRYVAIDFHGLFGAGYGIFDTAIAGYPANATPRPTDSYVGLYNNHTTPWGAAGGSIDFNTTPKLAVRLSPDMIFEHYGDNEREFFSISLGAVYRFGKRK